MLAAKGITTRDDLADLAADELAEMTGMDEERAKTLIMAARAPLVRAEAERQTGDAASEARR